jgi:hypothetical protein
MTTKQELMNTSAVWNDGFDECDDIEGQEQYTGQQGQRVKFTNDFRWVLASGETINPDREFVVSRIKRVVLKWGTDQKPVEYIVLKADEKFPDIERKNKETPRSEWVPDPFKKGELKGPWVAQHIVELIDSVTADKFWFPTNTGGGHRGVTELREKILWIHRTNGENAFPVVSLIDSFYTKNFGGKQRPHFVFRRCIRMDGLPDGGGGELSRSDAPQLTPPEPAKPVAAKQAEPIGDRLDRFAERERPSVAEDLQHFPPNLNRGE